MEEEVEGPGEGPGAGPGEGPGKGAGEGPGEGPGKGAGEGPGEGPGKGAGEGPGEGPGKGAGEGPGEGPGAGPGAGPGKGAGEGGLEEKPAAKPSNKVSSKKVVNEELQSVFDFFAKVQNTDKLDADLFKKIAERLAKLANPTLDKAPLTERQKLEQEVTKEVMNRLSGLVTANKVTKPTELRDILLAKNLDLVERAFESAVNTLIQYGRLTPEKAQALKNTKFRDFNYNAAKKVLLKQINLADELRKTFSQRRATLKNVVDTLLKNSNLTEAEAKRLGAALENVYNVEVKKRAESKLQALSKTKTFAAGAINKIPADPKFLELFKLGLFDEKEMYNRIALANPQLKLPVWNPVLVAEIKREAEMVMEMPEGDAKREKIIKLNSMVAEEHARNLSGTSKIKYWIGDVAPMIWQAGVLSGVPTQTVNFLSAHANVGLQALFQAMGYQVMAIKEGASLWDSFKFYGNIVSGWLTVVNFLDKSCSGKLLIQKALIEGSGRFKNLDTQQRSLLEQWKYLPHKYVGRVMTAADGVNCQIGMEIAMRNALTFALMKQGLNGEALAQKMASAFNPDVAILDGIEAKIEDAANRGFLGTGNQLDRNKRLMRIELLESYREELSGNKQLINQSQENAKDWTFNSDPKGIMGLVFDGVSSQLNRQLKVTKFILPFMRTMSNLVNNALDFSFVGLLRAHNKSPGFLLLSESNKYRLREVQRGSLEYNTLMAQGIAGTGMMLALMAMAAKGLDDEDNGKEPFFAVFGSGPKDPQKVRQLEQGSSWRRNSIKIGGQVLRYTDWPLLSLALGAIGSVCDMHRYDKGLSEKSTLDQAKVFALGIVNVIFEKNLISGLSNVMEVIRNPDARGAMALEKTASGILGGFFNPQALKWSRTTLEGLLDENGRSPVYDRSSTWGYWMGMFPFSGFGNKPMLNTLGQPVTQPWYQGVTGRFAAMDPTINKYFAPLVEKGLFIKSPNKNTEMRIGKEKIEVGVNDEVWRTFIELRGAELQKRLSPAFMSSLSNLSKEKAQSRLDKMTDYCREIATNKLRNQIRSGQITLQTGGTGTK